MASGAGVRFADNPFEQERYWIEAPRQTTAYRSQSKFQVFHQRMVLRSRGGRALLS